MKKLISKVLIVLIIVTLNIITSDIKVDANTISEITMDIILDENGTGHVTEKWYMDLDNGTEVYKPYSNLDEYEITNFKVTDEDGKIYETVDNWNINWGFQDKAYKCGIVNKANGVELCWGMSEYENKIFTIEYDIEGLVQQLKDAQSIYFGFMPDSMNPAPEKVKITINTNDTSLNNENAKIWSYGYYGTIEFVDGAVVLETTSIYISSYYMVALIKFEEPLFVAKNEINKEFEALKKEAMEGSDYEEIEEDDKYNETNSERFTIGTIIEIIITLIFVFLSFFTSIIFGPVGIIILVVLILYKARKPREGDLNFANASKTLPNYKSVDYYRDIPCNKSLYKAYFITEEYMKYNYTGSNNNKTGLIGAVLLKLIKEKRILIFETKGGIFNISNNEFSLNLKLLEHSNDEMENKLIDMLKAAAGENELLEAKEFEKWCQTNPLSVYNWFIDARNQGIKEFVSEGAIVEGYAKFGNKQIKQNFVNPEVREQAIQMLGLKRFLLDYSLISQREPIEVMLWEEYLMFAQILGIADRVEEQFSKLYPEINTQYNVDLKDLNRCVNNISISCVSATISRSRSTSTTRRTSYSSSHIRSSGGGGRSSSSGGGRSSGGRSSGGGTR